MAALERAEAGSDAQGSRGETKKAASRRGKGGKGKAPVNDVCLLKDLPFRLVGRSQQTMPLLPIMQLIAAMISMTTRPATGQPRQELEEAKV